MITKEAINACIKKAKEQAIRNNLYYYVCLMDPYPNGDKYLAVHSEQIVNSETFDGITLVTCFNNGDVHIH